jgi:hypothetical protein
LQADEKSAFASLRFGSLAPTYCGRTPSLAHHRAPRDYTFLTRLQNRFGSVPLRWIHVNVLPQYASAHPFSRASYLDRFDPPAECH